MLSGVAQACDEAGVALVLIPGSEERDSAHDIVRTAVVDGFVAHCDALDDERRAIVEDRRLPVVVLDGRARPDGPVRRHRRGGRRQPPPPTHLLELGHRRLAIVGFPPHGNTGSNLTTERRRNGYLSAIRAAGIDPRTVLEVEGSAYDRAETAVVARRILLRPDRPTAVLAMSDEMAVAVIDAAIGAGLRVPEDLSVVGFDDTRRRSRPVAHHGAPAARREGRRRGAHVARTGWRPGDHVPRRARRAGVDRRALIDRDGGFGFAGDLRVVAIRRQVALDDEGGDDDDARADGRRQAAARRTNDSRATSSNGCAGTRPCSTSPTTAPMLPSTAS